MNKEEAKKRIGKLIQEINFHRYNYHVLDKETLAPELLDKLKLELFDLENNFPDLIRADSPTQKVGGRVLDKFKKVSHSLPMISLFDAFSESDILAWQNRNDNYLKRKTNFSYYCELKLDGLAVSISYQNSLFSQAVTRGDGKVGEDVSANIKVISSVPLGLRKPEIKELEEIGLSKTEAERFLELLVNSKIEIRGEVIMTKTVFSELNKKYQKAGKALLANTRNAAAGSIRQLDPKISAERKLDFYVYDLILFDLNDKVLSRGELIKTRSMADQLIALLGFKRLKENYLAPSLKDVFSYYQKIEKVRENLPFEIDGVVVKVNDLKMWSDLGVVGKAPRYMMAYKFSAAQAITRVNDIIWQVGRTGTLTPIASLEPVKVAGALISRSTLHNFDEISRLDLRIKDTVVIERSGDVIPKVVNVLKNLRTGEEKKIKAPKFCPICETEVEQLLNEVAYRCSNKNCYAVNLRKIIHFISKGASNMDGLGPKVVEQFLALGLIRDVADLYSLKKEDLLSLERFAEKKADNIIKTIEQKKKINLANFIYALGIRHVGEETATMLAEEIVKEQALVSNNYLTIRDLLKFFTTKTESYFYELNDVGPIVASSIYQFWQDEHNLNLLEKFSKIGLKLSLENLFPKTGEVAGVFLNKTFVLSGTLLNLTRQEAKDRIKRAGGRVLADISAKTDFLLLGDQPGSKYEKAKKLKVRIINQTEFLEMLNQKD